MKPRSVATSQMGWRKSTDSTVSHYRYNEPQVRYNQSFVTYNYYSSRGESSPRIIAIPTMKNTSNQATGNKVKITPRTLASTMMRGR